MRLTAALLNATTPLMGCFFQKADRGQVDDDGNDDDDDARWLLAKLHCLQIWNV
jgi:hypothetical protein